MVCTLDDIKKLMSTRTLIELTHDVDDQDIGEPLPDVINETIVNDAIRYAQELIDAYLRGRYTLPLEVVPTVLRDLAVSLVCHRLYIRRPQGNLPDAVKEMYKGSLKTLEAIRDGKLTLGIQQHHSALPEKGEFQVSATPPKFGGKQGLLEKYT